MADNMRLVMQIVCAAEETATHTVAELRKGALPWQTPIYIWSDRRTDGPAQAMVHYWP
jgi:hypothetical protein